MLPITNYQLPYIDFGGTGPVLHFANANGYPPAAYAPLFESLTPYYHVIAVRSRPLQPGADPASLRSWTQLADELVAFLDRAASATFAPLERTDGVGHNNEASASANYRPMADARPQAADALPPAGTPPPPAPARPFIGVGHSLGAVLTVLAALRRPELFSAVVAIEPVFFNPLKLMVYDVFRGLGLADRVHPLIAGARRRRRYFASAEEVYERYRQAPVFRRLDDRSLRAYVAAAVRPRAEGEGVELVFTPEWEAQVYATGPFNLWRQLGKLSVPLLVIRGAESDTFDQGAVKALQSRLPRATLVDFPGTGHLVPLEKPAELGKLIVDFMRGVENQ